MLLRFDHGVDLRSLAVEEVSDLFLFCP